MHTYIVTCRQPDGQVVERRVKARDHRAAQRILIDEGMGDVVVVDRETRADHVVNRKARGIVLAICIALPVAIFAVWRFMKFVGQWVK